MILITCLFISKSWLNHVIYLRTKSATTFLISSSSLMEFSVQRTTKIALLFLLQLVAAQWKSEVTKQKSGMSYRLQPFDDSPVILREDNSKLSRSSDNSKTWELVDSIKGNTSFFKVDKNYPGKRVFAYAVKSGTIYATDDQEETWSEISLP